MLQISPGDTLLVSFQQKQRDTTLFPQAKIYNSSNTLIATVNLTHQTNGLYTGTTASLTTIGLYAMQILIYTDSGRTALSGVDETTSDTITCEYPYRPAMGASTAEIDLNLFKELHTHLDKLEEQLNKKSEFNPRDDIVKTDLKMPVFNPRETNEKIDNLFSKIKEIPFGDINKKIDKMNSILSVPPKKIDFSEIKQMIKEIDLSPFREIKQQIEKLDQSIWPQIELLDLKNRIDQILFNQQNKKGNELVIMSRENIAEIIKTIPNEQTQEIINNFKDGLGEVIVLVRENEKMILKSDRANEIKNILEIINKIQTDISVNEKLIEILNVQSHKRNEKTTHLIKDIFKNLKSTIGDISLQVKNQDEKQGKSLEEVSDLLEINNQLISLKEVLTNVS